MSEPRGVSVFHWKFPNLGVKVTAVKGVLMVLAVLSGFILSRLGLPASFLTGPLLVAAFFAVTNRPVIRFNLFIYRLAQSVIGVMLSFTITAIILSA
jgi:uncharacterized membrane protein AbrB (regulator of aidB expression)